MLRIRKCGFRLLSQGYHYDENGKKFIRVYGIGLDYIKIQVKIQPHKEMHIKSRSVIFPYVITDNWVEIMINCTEWIGYAHGIEDYIDKRCKEIWFV
jgi:hypothetical protein